MTPDQINQFFSFLHQGWLGTVTRWLEFFAGILTSAMLAAIIVISIKFRQLNARSRTSTSQTPRTSFSEETVAQPWREVLGKLKSSSPADWNIAVIQADSIFDAVTKNMGLGGVTLGDRLRSLDPSKLQSLRDVWEAHKIRNRIVHETDIELNREEAEYAVRLFEKGLRELQYLQG